MPTYAKEHFGMCDKVREKVHVNFSVDNSQSTLSLDASKVEVACGRTLAMQSSGDLGALAYQHHSDKTRRLVEAEGKIIEIFFKTF